MRRASADVTAGHLPSQEARRVPLPPAPHPVGFRSGADLGRGFLLPDFNATMTRTRFGLYLRASELTRLLSGPACFCVEERPDETTGTLRLSRSSESLRDSEWHKGRKDGSWIRSESQPTTCSSRSGAAPISRKPFLGQHLYQLSSEHPKRHWHHHATIRPRSLPRTWSQYQRQKVRCYPGLLIPLAVGDCPMARAPR